MKAYMSFINLMANNANFNCDGKLATLWFDQLLLGSDSELVEKAITDVSTKEKWSSDTLKEFKKVQVSTQKILPDVVFTDTELVKDKYSVATEVMREYYSKELSNPKTYSGAMHEVIMGGAGISAAVKYWMILNAKENCVFLPEAHEKSMLNSIFADSYNSEFDNFSNVISSIIPDISEYTWDEIIDLRHHQYWEQFRNKITMLSKTLTDEKTAAEIIDEIAQKDLVELALHFKPKVKKNIIKGMACNIPLPIPINPASIICTGYDIVKEIDFEKKYGWLYFYLENKTN